jgi:hypothetical protein
VENELITLKGSTEARIFRRGELPVEVAPGSSLGAIRRTRVQVGA